MTVVHDLAGLIDVRPDATTVRHALQAAGARVELMAFDSGRVLRDHVAAVPMLLLVLDGRLRVRAESQSVDLVPGGLVHVPAWVPQSFEALDPTRLALVLLDDGH
jgi:quercetin dioxygenase-like cupin family protein